MHAFDVRSRKILLCYHTTEERHYSLVLAKQHTKSATRTTQLLISIQKYKTFHALEQPASRQTRHSEAANDAGIARCARQHSLRQIFRIGTVRYAAGLWCMRRHGPVIAHCTDSEDFPSLLHIPLLSVPR